ncbi:MAG: hypothetical protein H0T85_02045 [Geodermatophilaceae bacterium]|nr:hypothetical protein [Geodermatophilaceae bacterium]
MATLQVRQLPDDVHAELRRRANADGVSLSELVTQVLRREVALPSMAGWLAELRTAPERGPVDVLGALDAVRDERG